jgi:predicted transcriptional regulator
MDLLKIAQKGERKTKIMYDANLSFAQIEKYPAILENAGLIAKEESFWRTTEKGVNVMESCKTCQLLMKQIQQQQIE